MKIVKNTNENECMKAEGKSSFRLPFIASRVDLNKCNGLAYNRGLFTQCPKEKMTNISFCKKCQSECNASATGIPLCGSVEQRLATGLYEFKDTKGRSPIRYIKYLDKANISVFQAQYDAGDLSLEIDEEHFVYEEKPKKTKAPATTRCRPKKPVGAVEADMVI